jgi:hypothetical protein
VCVCLYDGVCMCVWGGVHVRMFLYIYIWCCFEWGDEGEEFYGSFRWEVVAGVITWWLRSAYASEHRAEGFSKLTCDCRCVHSDWKRVILVNVTSALSKEFISLLGKQLGDRQSSSSSSASLSCGYVNLP